jgi:hypothetical protein
VSRNGTKRPLVSRTVGLGQVIVGVIALGWVVFLLPRTGFIWWLAGNAAYGALALIAAALHLGGHRAEGRGLAIIGAAIFVASNGAVAILACSTGGACIQILAVIGLLVALQIAVLAGAQGAG